LILVQNQISSDIADVRFLDLDGIKKALTLGSGLFV
jgi:hypothetical protein